MLQNIRTLPFLHEFFLILSLPSFNYEIFDCKFLKHIIGPFMLPLVNFVSSLLRNSMKRSKAHQILFLNHHMIPTMPRPLSHLSLHIFDIKRLLIFILLPYIRTHRNRSQFMLDPGNIFSLINLDTRLNILTTVFIYTTFLIIYFPWSQNGIILFLRTSVPLIHFF